MFQPAMLVYQMVYKWVWNNCNPLTNGPKMNGVFTTHFEKKFLLVGGGSYIPFIAAARVGGQDRKAHSFRFFGQLTPSWGPALVMCWTIKEGIILYKYQVISGIFEVRIPGSWTNPDSWRFMSSLLGFLLLNTAWYLPTRHYLEDHPI